MSFDSRLLRKRRPEWRTATIAALALRFWLHLTSEQQSYLTGMLLGTMFGVSLCGLIMGLLRH